MKIPSILKTISDDLKSQNAKAIIVGGSVRDHFLGNEIKDYDIEVYNLDSLESLERILGKYGSVNLVGKSFGVLKFVYGKDEFDFSFPRTETKISQGHKGFDVSIDGSLQYKVAAKRRDFTINAMGYDIDNGDFIDPFDALNDIKSKSIRHIDDQTFAEDPLRVYRAVQFTARFGYKLADETFDLCRSMIDNGKLDELPKERVYMEWQKLLLKSAKPSIGFELMKDLGIIKRYFPELDRLINTPQSPKWHPEGDVWIHTMMTLDQMATLCKSESKCINDAKKHLKMMFAILCHDLGKPATTAYDNGQIRAIGHEKAGIEPCRSLLMRLTNEHNFIDSILPLIEHHLKPSQFYKNGAKSSAIRRVATKANIEELVLVAKADFLGRATKDALSGEYKAGEWMLQRAKELNVKHSPPKPLLQGADLITLGLKPSPLFGKILNEIYNMQLDGKLKDKDEAMEFIEREYF